MSAYVMFYLRDDKTSHWVELDSWSRSCEMYKIVSHFVDFEQWREIDRSTLHAMQDEIESEIEDAKNWISKERANLEFITKTKCSLREIMDEKASIDSAITEWEETLRELDGARHELEVFESFLVNSEYNDCRIHLAIAHECDPNDDAAEDDA